jgi:hypothetical protein
VKARASRKQPSTKGAEKCSVNVDVAKLKCQGESSAVIGYLPAARVKMAVINWAAV